MDNSLLISVLLFFFGGAIGAVVIWAINAKGISTLRDSLSRESQIKLQLDETINKLEEELSHARSQADAIREELVEKKSEAAAQAARIDEREKALVQQREQFESQREELKKDFENLSNKIFEDKGKKFSEQNQTQLNALLEPFKQKVDSFQKRVNEIHVESVKGNTNLEAEIRKVLEVGINMQSEASNLASALKGDSQQRGAWGEAQLERTLEMSGLVKGAHYAGQESFKDSEGKTKRTDYILKLPDGKHMVIDSKVSLVAYDDAVSADSEEQAVKALAAHVQAVRAHIDDLASKDYTDLVGVNSPPFVLMFMPIEPAYIEALKHEKDLFSYGFSKSIVLVSHTTLIPILKTVSSLWMREQSNQEARELGDKALDIFNSVATVADRLEKLGSTLKSAGNHYTATVTAMVGQQGLYGKVDRFSQLSSKAKKELSDLQPVHLDVEDPRLQIEARPVITEDTKSLTEDSEGLVDS